MSCKLIFCFFFLLSTQIYCQDIASVFSKKTETGYTIYATNNNAIEVSVLVNLKTENMLVFPNNNNKFVVPAYSKNYELLTMQPKVACGKNSFSFSCVSNYGNAFSSLVDSNFVYELPFLSNIPYLLYQGYNGSFSHQNQYALDFTMPIGTKVLAARSGIVVKIEDNYFESCLNDRCKKLANYVLIYHNDGSFAKYVHLKQKGVLVNVGDSVLVGTEIALSGNTGFTTGPHLHFECFMPYIDTKNKTTIPTKFRINKDNIEYLEEGNSYQSYLEN
jgi:Peptidase family M23